MNQYFSQQDCADFASQLPRIRQRIGVKSFVRRDIGFGVGGNTFRAFHGVSPPPSQIYREWAAEVCARLDPQSLVQVSQSQRSFYAWHATLASSLADEWISRCGQPISLAHNYKLVDLFVKWLVQHDVGTQEAIDGLVQFGNCALDSQSLATLNRCLSYALPLDKPSMGHIRTKVTYDYCQSLVHDFAVPNGGTRLLFDFYAWKPGGNA